MRGRYGSPVKTPKGSIRLMSCQRCGMTNMVAAMVVDKRTADAIEHLLGMG